MSNVLVAGATGAIGSCIVELLDTEGRWDVRRLVRGEAKAPRDVVGDALDRASIRGVADGIDVVVSAVGASVALELRGRRSYLKVDTPANVNLLAEAERAGVSRFVYVGVHSEPPYAHTRYLQAHERVVEALAASPISSTVVRPTGVFTALDDFLDMARRGRAHVLGDGTARTNPIHPLDVAAAIVARLCDGPENVSVGGPEVLTRNEIAERAFEALGKVPKISNVPAGLVRFMTPLVRLFHPRLSELISFAEAVSTHDAVAPVAGERTSSIISRSTSPSSCCSARRETRSTNLHDLMPGTGIGSGSSSGTNSAPERLNAIASSTSSKACWRCSTTSASDVNFSSRA